MNKNAFIVSVSVLLISILIVSLIYAYLEILSFYIETEEKVLLLKIVDRKCKNIEYIIRNAISEVFTDVMSTAATNALPKNKIEKILNKRYFELLDIILNDQVVRRYLLTDNETIRILCSKLIVTEYRYVNFNRIGNFLLLDSIKNDGARSCSVCCLASVKYKYDNNNHGISYQRNSSLVVCIPLCYFKIYSIGKEIASRLDGKSFNLNCNTTLQNFLGSIFCIYKKYNVKIEYTVSCERKGEMLKCLLNLKIIDLYAKENLAKIHYLLFPALNFYITYSNCTEEGYLKYFNAHISW